MTADDATDRTDEPGLVVYGADWCPDVRRSRAALEASGTPYRYVDIEQDRTALKVVRRLQRGRRRIPTLVWPDGTFLVEPSDDDLGARLREARHGSTP